MSQEYADKLGLAPVECSCERCQNMCMAPCCGSVEDMEKLIDAGYAKRLMLDDLPDSSDNGLMLKPALKRYEGRRSPWITCSLQGCTFWNKERKCDLHDLNLKPIQGRLAIHDQRRTSTDAYAKISRNDWDSLRGQMLIARWKELVHYDE